MATFLPMGFAASIFNMGGFPGEPVLGSMIGLAFATLCLTAAAAFHKEALARSIHGPQWLRNAGPNGCETRAPMVAKRRPRETDRGQAIPFQGEAGSMKETVSIYQSTSEILYQHRILTGHVTALAP
ncbi:hypothetical protein EJ07DRAFT_155345 [Lizonia empirigonia]|nr:hypothetical protein EJ07DRAFT_155345 [Lizonia empirigonia]